MRKLLKGIALAVLAVALPALAQAGGTAPGTNATEQAGAASSKSGAKMPDGAGHGEVGTAGDGAKDSMEAKKPAKKAKKKPAGKTGSAAGDNTTPATH
jgi:hypothetical protein